MTLTLDEVNRIRFPMARRPNEGYRAGEVDDFVDNVVATFTAMNAETDRLKAQLDALKSDPGAGGGSSSSDEEKSALVEENQRLRDEIERLESERVEHGPSEGEQADDGGAAAAELDELRRAKADLEERLAAAEAAAHDQSQHQGEAQPFAGGGEPQVEKIVVTTSSEASSSAVRLVALATEQAESTITGAEKEAAEVRQAAEQEAAEAKQAAEAEAEEIRAAAQAEADQLRAEAKSRSEKVDSDAKARRVELFATLEREREEFAGKIDELKTWESSYRTSIISHLKAQVEQVESGSISPEGLPLLVGDERGNSATPRLDALLATKTDHSEDGSE